MRGVVNVKPLGIDWVRECGAGGVEQHRATRLRACGSREREEKEQYNQHFSHSLVILLFHYLF
jgi:hypothetical protein